MVQFVYREEITFRAKVFIAEPTWDGRKVTTQVWGHFKVQGSDETDALLKEIAEAANRGQPTKDLEMATLQNVVRGWDDIVTEDKTPLDFSDVARDALLNVPYIRSAFWRAYVDAISGAAKRGN